MGLVHLFPDVTDEHRLAAVQRSPLLSVAAYCKVDLFGEWALLAFECDEEIACWLFFGGGGTGQVRSGISGVARCFRSRVIPGKLR